MVFSTVRFAMLVALLVTPAFAGQQLLLKSGTVHLSRAAKVSAFGSSTSSGLWVVQFQEAIRPVDRDLVESLGATIVSYLPEDALIIRGSGSVINQLDSFRPTVAAVGAFSPSWKFGEMILEEGVTNQDAIQILVPVAADLLSVEADLKSMRGLKIHAIGENSFVVSGSRVHLSTIAGLSEVTWIEKMPVFTTFDFQVAEAAESPKPTPAPVDFGKLTGYESGVRLIGGEQAWSRGYFGEGQIGAMADTGCDVGNVAGLHPDLKPNVPKGYAVGLMSFGWDDPQAHGTHVSGSIVGNGARSENKIKAVAHKAKLIPGGMWSPIMNNLMVNPDLPKLFQPMFKDGARVHSNSWGAATNLGAYDQFANAVDKYLWENPDMLILFAAGNSGEDANKDGVIDEGSVSSPGTAKNVLTVGASKNYLLEGGIQKPAGELREGDKKWGAEPIKSSKLSENPQGLAPFSSRGPTRDGRIKPEIVAPGTNIISTRSKHKSATALWGEFGADYLYAGGTSMATPITASAALIAREYLMKAMKQSSPSGALVKATLIHTAMDLFPGQFGTGPKQELAKVRPNAHEGYGRVDLDKLTQVGSETQVQDDRDGVATGEEKSYTIQVGPNGLLQATLVYTDAPAAANAAKALVNDIDLMVVDQSGKTVTTNDHVNNHEMIELKDLAAGSYTVKVKGVNVPDGKNGKQPFALIMSSK